MVEACKQAAKPIYTTPYAIPCAFLDVIATVVRLVPSFHRTAGRGPLAQLDSLHESPFPRITSSHWITSISSSAFFSSASGASVPSQPTIATLCLITRNSPFISASPSASIRLRIACPIFFSSLRAFLELSFALGPLLGSSPGLAPRVESALLILFLADSLRFCRCARALVARAARRFLDGPLGFFTDGIVGVCARGRLRVRGCCREESKSSIKRLSLKAGYRKYFPHQPDLPPHGPCMEAGVSAATTAACAGIHSTNDFHCSRGSVQRCGID